MVSAVSAGTLCQSAKAVRQGMSQGWRHEGTAVVLGLVNICVVRSQGNGPF